MVLAWPVLMVGFIKLSHLSSNLVGVSGAFINIVCQLKDFLHGILVEFVVSYSLFDT